MEELTNRPIAGSTYKEIQKNKFKKIIINFRFDVYVSWNSVSILD